MSILAYKIRNIYFYILLRECLVLCVKDDLQFWERDPKHWTVKKEIEISHNHEEANKGIPNVNHPVHHLPMRRVIQEDTLSDYYSDDYPQSNKHENNANNMRSRNRKHKTSLNKGRSRIKEENRERIQQSSKEKVTKGLYLAYDDDIRSVPPAMAIKYDSVDDNDNLTQLNKFEKIHGRERKHRLHKKQSRLDRYKKKTYMKDKKIFEDLISKKLAERNQNKKTDEKESIQGMLHKWETFNKGDKTKNRNNMTILGEDNPYLLDKEKKYYLQQGNEREDPHEKSKRLLRDPKNRLRKKPDDNESVFTSDYDTKEMKTESENGESSGVKAASVMWTKYTKYKMNKQHKKHAGRNRDEERNTYESTRMTTEYSRKPDKDSYKNENSHVEVDGKLDPCNIAQQLLYLHDKVESQAHIEQEVIGRTMNYYDIVLWKIRDKNDNYKFRASDNHKYDDETEKKIVFIVHGLDIKGWTQLPCLSEVKQFKKLLSYYLENLDSFDIFLIPLANPDGVSRLSEALNNDLGGSPFKYTWAWEKNLSPQEACSGVALDRNFDVGWNVSINASSCHMQYPGPAAFSERETQAIRDIFHRYGAKIIAYFHVHSGTFHAQTFKGDAVLYPRGFTDTQSDDDRYIDLKGEIDEAMRNASFKVLSVTVDTLHNWYGTVGGTSVDYASTVYGVPYAMELVMQIYDNEPHESKVSLQELALQEVWQLLIDVIFDHIYKTEIKNKEEEYRRRARRH